MKILKGIIAVLLCHSLLAFGSDGKGRYAVLGLGNTSCGKYLGNEDYHDPVNVWLTGYLTSTNNLYDGVSDISEGIDISSMELWLKNWCQANPLGDVNKAAVGLVNELLARRKPRP